MTLGSAVDDVADAARAVIPDWAEVHTGGYSRNMKRAQLVRRALSAGIGVAALMSLSLPAAASVPTSTPLVIGSSTLQDIVDYVADHDDAYGGVVFDETTGQYVVTQTRSAPSGLPSLKSLVSSSLSKSNAQASPADGTTVRLAPTTRTVERSTKQLLQLRDQIRLNPAAAGPASSATYWAINPGSNKVIVGLEQPITEGLVAQAQARYGDGVELRQVPHFTTAVGKLDLKGKPLRIVDTLQWVGLQSQAQTAAAATYTRLNDNPAGYSAGNRIAFLAADKKSGNICTTAWMNTSNRHIFTAGHCFAAGTTVLQGNIVCTTVCSAPGSGVIGTVYTRQWGDNRPDWEGINTVSGKSISAMTYTGGSTSSTRVPQGSMIRSAVLNASVCASGSVTGYSCGKVTSNEGCAKVDAYIVCGLQAVERQDGGRIVQHGDSGGPVRSVSTSGTYGVISAGNPDQGGTFLLFSNFRAICAVAGECPAI